MPHEPVSFFMRLQITYVLFHWLRGAAYGQLISAEAEVDVDPNLLTLWEQVRA